MIRSRFAWRLLVSVSFGLSVAAPSTSVLAQQQGIFSGLPYEEHFIREKIAQYSIRTDSTDASWQIPANLTYQLAFREILADRSLLARIRAADADSIRNLPAPLGP